MKKLVFIVIIALVFPVIAAASQEKEKKDAAVNVTGTWVFDVQTSAGSGTPTMTFKQEGEKLTGQYSGQLGELPLTGTVKDSKISFQFDVSVEGTNLTIVYSGTVEKDSMKGTVSLGPAGDGTFTAKRK
jgi:hypothetical protein